MSHCIVCERPKEACGDNGNCIVCGTRFCSRGSKNAVGWAHPGCSESMSEAERGIERRVANDIADWLETWATDVPDWRDYASTIHGNAADAIRNGEWRTTRDNT